MAKRAKENTELAQIEERKKLNTLYTQLELNSEGEGSGRTSYEAIEKLLEFKKAIAGAIKTAGGKETDYNAETSTFEENIKGIVAEVTKNATATAEDIAEGKTAWVDGIKITGSSAVADFSKLKNIYANRTIGSASYTATEDCLFVLFGVEASNEFEKPTYSATGCTVLLDTGIQSTYIMHTKTVILYAPRGATISYGLVGGASRSTAALWAGAFTF